MRDDDYWDDVEGDEIRLNRAMRKLGQLTPEEQEQADIDYWKRIEGDDPPPIATNLGRL